MGRAHGDTAARRPGEAGCEQAVGAGTREWLCDWLCPKARPWLRVDSSTRAESRASHTRGRGGVRTSSGGFLLPDGARVSAGRAPLPGWRDVGAPPHPALPPTPICPCPQALASADVSFPGRLACRLFWVPEEWACVWWESEGLELYPSSEF